jgi:hypothetical protein
MKATEGRSLTFAVMSSCRSPPMVKRPPASSADVGCGRVGAMSTTSLLRERIIVSE